MIPGINLLKMSLTIIASQVITYYQAVDRSLNDIGQDVTEYNPPVTIRGSFQPVPRKLYTQYGLDFDKTYYTFYTSNDLIDVGRDVSGDQIVFGTQRFQCESSNDWFALDGWVGMLCVLIENQITAQAIWGFDSIPSVSGNQNFGNGNFQFEAEP